MLDAKLGYSRIEGGWRGGFSLPGESPGWLQRGCERHRLKRGQRQDSLPVDIWSMRGLGLDELPIAMADLVTASDGRKAGVLHRRMRLHGGHSTTGHGRRGRHAQRHGLAADSTSQRACLQGDQQEQECGPCPGLESGALHETNVADA